MHLNRSDETIFQSEFSFLNVQSLILSGSFNWSKNWVVDPTNVNEEKRIATDENKGWQVFKISQPNWQLYKNSCKKRKKAMPLSNI